MKKGFFKVFIPENSVKQLKIPTNFAIYKNGKLPRNVYLRDRFGNMWPIGVTKIESNLCFQDGWEKFVEDNNIELGDFLIFDYDGNKFDFKLLGISGCEKKGVGGLKLAVNVDEEGEMNTQHQKSVEPKENNWASDSNNNSSYNDSDEDYIVEEEEENEDNEHEVVVEEKDKEEIENASRSKHRYVEEEDKNERADTYKKREPQSKAGCKRATASKVRDRHDYFGADIFKSGCATQPKNPYFVAKIRSYRGDEVFVPIDVVRDYKLELPSSMTIRDSAGRKYETKLKTWKDGRIWLVGGWRSLCRWNLMEKNGKCICEFVREKCNKGLYLQVQVLHEGATSRPKKKNKK